MELRQYFSLVQKWFWLVFLAVAVAAGSSYVASRASTPLYYTKTTLMVGRVTQNPDPTSVDIYTGQQLAYTYTQLARREPVLRGTIESLGLEMSWEALAGQVSANIIPQTQLLEISVIDSDPYRAKVLADAIGQQLILQSPSTPNGTSPEQVAFMRDQLTDLQDKIKKTQAEIVQLKQELDAANSARQIQNLSGQINLLDTKVSDWQNTYSQLLISLQGGNTNTLSVLEEATVPSYPIAPNIQKNVLLASAIGLVLSVGGIILIEYLDDTVKTVENMERNTRLPSLGIIARIDGEKYPDKLVTLKHPLSPIVEAYRVLRTNLQFSAVDHPLRTLMVTSAGPGEGKSVTLANLAVVLAQSGMRVILVDTDLRRPVMHKIFELPNRHGLSDAVLHPSSMVAERLQLTEIKNLRLLTSGPLPPNPAELLGSERMRETIAELSNEADLVLFDSPPVLMVADSTILGGRMDGVVLVVDAGRTRSSDARQAVENLRRVKITQLGAILNRVSTASQGYYYRYYRHEDDDSGEPKQPATWFGRKFGRLVRMSQAYTARHRSNT